MNAKKCVYTIFSKGNCKISLNLKLYNEIIPCNPNPLFLGIIFDECLCFNKHYEYLQERSLKRLNIIKIFFKFFINKVEFCQSISDLFN